MKVHIMTIWYKLVSFCSFLAPLKSCYFLFLDKKKVTQEKSRLQIILGLLFFCLPTQYNSGVLPYSLAPSLKLPTGQFFTLDPLKQYCLQKAYAASLKTIAISQNSLRPFEIRPTIKMSLNILSCGAGANRKW
jgi:hypothetical protein